ncbi:peptide/nickel transport system substrate-binding protein [Methanophagales archaeon]|nr:peptide/nickel transport system substrate-binding protein [Methanophagales archaeon]
MIVGVMLLASMPMATAKLYGDANEDGVIDEADMSYVWQIIAGEKPKNELADANQDGEIDARDATYIENIILGNAPHPGKTLRIAIGDEPDDLNPLAMYSHSQSDLLKFFNGLLKFDEDLDLVPDLAESWDVSDDGEECTFHLRQGVMWHDGEEFTAEDVKYTYDLILSGDVTSMIPLATEYSDIIEEVEIVDDYTVKFTLQEAMVPFRERFAVAIVPKHLLEDEDLTETDFWQNPVGTGPYEFKEWAKGDKLVMVANPNYFAGAPVISELTFVFVPEETARVSLLKGGEVDITKIDARTKRTLTGESGIEIYIMPAANWYGLTLPTKTVPFTDKKVRQAIAYAINKQLILDTIFYGEGEVAYGPFRNSSWVYNPEIEYIYDPDKARQLLAQAGYNDTDGDAIVEKDGKKLEFTVMYPVSDIERRDIAIAVTTDLAAVGIKAELEGLSWSEIKARLHDDPYTVAWGSPYDPDVLNYKLWHSKFLYQGWYNPACYENPAVDALLDEGRTTFDTEERERIYGEFQEILVDDQPVAFFLFSDYVYAVNDQLAGIIATRPGPHGAGVSGGMTGELWWNVEDWDIEQ